FTAARGGRIFRWWPPRGPDRSTNPGSMVTLMADNLREVIVVGDKVLIKPEEESSKTPSGLYLPQGLAAKESVAGGYIVNVGPGYPTIEPTAEGEIWSNGHRNEMRYVPLQARKGDFAIFQRREAIEVEIDGSKYQIVGHSSILLLIRDRVL